MYIINNVETTWPLPLDIYTEPQYYVENKRVNKKYSFGSQNSPELELCYQIWKILLWIWNIFVYIIWKNNFTKSLFKCENLMKHGVVVKSSTLLSLWYFNLSKYLFYQLQSSIKNCLFINNIWSQVPSDPWC